MFDDPDSGTTSSLSMGAKIAIIAAIPFILLGVYFLLAPITELRTTSGAVFNCGSAISPSGDKWTTSICQDINQTFLYRGIASIASGVLMAAAGMFLFGSSRSGHDSSNFEPADASLGNRSRNFD